jgi:hypothetical protein
MKIGKIFSSTRKTLSQRCELCNIYFLSHNKTHFVGEESFAGKHYRRLRRAEAAGGG